MMRRTALVDLDRLAILEKPSFCWDGVNRRSMRHFLRSDATAVLLDECEGRLRGHVVLGASMRVIASRAFIPLQWLPNTSGRASVSNSYRAAEAMAKGRRRLLVRLEISVDDVTSQALIMRAGNAGSGEYEEYYKHGGAALRLKKLIVDTLP